MQKQKLWSLLGLLLNWPWHGDRAWLFFVLNFLSDNLVNCCYLGIVGYRLLGILHKFHYDVDHEPDDDRGDYDDDGDGDGGLELNLVQPGVLLHAEEPLQVGCWVGARGYASAQLVIREWISTF